ncbi:MAG: bifunctional diaminohydroxyphosphoribosylaminopyrimidine deaminase/5-amino-6-(5-phosphoribosylamino)uracil reductase RibD [Saprospiraceae bacterium]|nr:bifunctional diaminohydroxyphosphoribosylaminopyrimidine deaminase/5-amino-6-(5-phosphoribosylamino)uracil reductase RibD [Saprospiraceae bacterium]
MEAPVIAEKKYMDRCFELALKGGKHTKTNPMVGCVIVYDNQIIGEGYHEKYGGNHAEINAIECIPHDINPTLKDCIVYISLEPCCHYGNTPPCAHRLIADGFRKFVIGCPDPNPKVSGKGMAYLRSFGALVVESFCHDQAFEIITKFRINLGGMPYVILKWAQSSDNYIGKRDQQIWLSNTSTTILSHKWRSEVDGIMIGKNTANTDNPSLTNRHYEGSNPVRIVLDSQLALKKHLTLYNDDLPTWTLNVKMNKAEGSKKYILVNNTADIKLLLRLLFTMGIYSIIVEGGAKVLNSFKEQNIWHEARIIRTAVKLEDGINAPDIQGKLLRKMKSGDNEVLFIRNPSEI